MYKDKLIELREEKELKQFEVASILSIYKGTYNQYETEYLVIPLKHLLTLCNYFDVSLDYVFNFSKSRQYSNPNYEIDKRKSGQRLKELRINNKYTQVKFAEKLHTSQSVIADYERGRYMIATPFLYMLCKKHKISADYLLGRIDNPKYI